MKYRNRAGTETLTIIRTGVRNLSLAALLLLQACRDNEPPEPAAPPRTGERQVYVVCEGSLGNGNSALTLYLPDRDTVYTDVFRSVNSQPLGDVFQSITQAGQRFLLCINNSDRILAIDKDTRVLSGTVTLPKPRYITQATAGKAYVSTLFSDQLYTIDTRTLEITGRITMPAENPEGMWLEGDRLYVCAWDTACRELYELDVNSDRVVRRIGLAGAAPHAVVGDRDGMLWVLAGNTFRGKSATFTRLDPATGTILRRFEFPQGADPVKPVMNKTRDTIYYLGVNYDGGTAYNGVYRMAVTDTELPGAPLIPAGAYQYFWALGIEPGTGNIYVGDPKGFIQRGIIYVYSPSGQLLSQFTSGVGPGGFFFHQY